jgi:hypothetical protein
VERRGGEAGKEAQAREQYFRFQIEAQNALTGKLVEGTRTRNGSTGGTFRGTGGVYVNERRLRYMMGIPISDGQLIRPSDEPPEAEIVFDWETSVLEATSRRNEIIQQKLRLKQRKMEFEAANNFLKPRFDAVALYRWRGFGKDLLETKNPSGAPFDNAFQNMSNGDFQEWQVGFEMTTPIGFRREHAAVRNAELRVARAVAILKQQEQLVILDLSNAGSDKDRAYVVTQTSYNRRNAAKERLDAVQAAYDADKATPAQVLEAQRFLADAESKFYLARVEYAMAVKNVHFEKGSLMDYHNIHLVGDALAPDIDPTMGGKLEVRWPHLNWLLSGKPRRLRDSSYRVPRSWSTNPISGTSHEPATSGTTEEENEPDTSGAPIMVPPPASESAFAPEIETVPSVLQLPPDPPYTIDRDSAALYQRWYRGTAAIEPLQR